MEASAGLVAGSHNRNELVVIRRDGDPGVRARFDSPGWRASVTVADFFPLDFFFGCVSVCSRSRCGSRMGRCARFAATTSVSPPAGSPSWPATSAPSPSAGTATSTSAGRAPRTAPSARPATSASRVRAPNPETPATEMQLRPAANSPLFSFDCLTQFPFCRLRSCARG